MALPALAGIVGGSLRAGSVVARAAGLASLGGTAKKNALQLRRLSSSKAARRAALKDLGSTGKFVAGAGVPLGIAGTGIFGAETFAPPFQEFVGAGEQQQSIFEQAIGDKREARIQGARLERLQSLMSENMANLAALSPHTFNELATGRRLVQGEEVIGGKRDNTFLNEVLRMATQGELDPPKTQRQLLSEELLGISLQP